MSDSRKVLYSVDEGVARITLNRPEKRNALDTALSRALLEALRAADGDETVRCVVLTGAGPAFCAATVPNDLESCASILERRYLAAERIRGREGSRPSGTTHCGFSRAVDGTRVRGMST